MTIQSRRDDSFVHVPTVPELHATGLAIVTARNKKKEPTHYQVKPEGQRMIYDAMAHNAARGHLLDERG